MSTNRLDGKALVNVRAAHGLGAVVACLILGLSYQLLLDPLAQQAAEHERRAAELEESLRAAPKTRAENERMQAQVSEARARLERLLALVPETTREAEFLELLTESAHEAGVEIRDFRPGTARARDRYHQLEVQVAAEGDFQSFSRWLHQIGKLPRLTRTQNLTITSAPAGQGRQCVLTMTLAVFFGAKTDSTSKGSANG
jgi:Tfp pilus assembly protein PilO